MLTLGLPALTLSIGCAVAYSAADYFRKAIPLSASAPLALFYAFVLETPVLAAWLLVSGDIRLTADYVWPGLVAALIGLGANMFFIIAVRRSPLSLMVPLLALIPVTTTLLGGAVLGEWPKPLQGVGIVTVVVGLFILYIPTDGGFHPLHVWRHFLREPGARPMIGVVTLWSLSPPVDKVCVAASSVGMHGLLQLMILWITLGGWLLFRGGPRALIAPRAAWKPLIGGALAAGLAYGLQLAAYKIALVGIVELFKRSIGLVSALIFGRAYFQEKITGPKIAGIAVMAAGLAIVLAN